MKQLHDHLYSNALAGLTSKLEDNDRAILSGNAPDYAAYRQMIGKRLAFLAAIDTLAHALEALTAPDKKPAKPTTEQET